MLVYCFFFFNDTATTEIYTLSLHDALPICEQHRARRAGGPRERVERRAIDPGQRRRIARRARGKPVREARGDRKSTRLNSSHSQKSYAVFCLKKKKQTTLSLMLPHSTQSIG